MITSARHGRTGRFQRLYLASVISVLVVTQTWAQDTHVTSDYSQPAMSLVRALNGISQQSGIQVIYDAHLLEGKRAMAFSGHLSIRQALDKALQGTGLTYEFVNDDTAVIRGPHFPVPSATRKEPTTINGNEAAAATETLDAVNVTGTRIQGGTSPSPTISLSQAEFRQQGLNDLGEVIRDIPQNYRGGQNPGVSPSPGGGDVTNQDVTGGSALNLRGLGPDATLTLLNGRRMSYDGFVQAVDIGAIPIEAVDRLEIVPDGASALYGSDAVAGVANVILKRDFEGVTLGTRYGSSTEGGLTTHEYSATAGTTWNSGGLIASLKKENQDPINADQRGYTRQMEDPTTIYPGSSLKSGLFSLHQSLGAVAEFSLDALRTIRGQTTTSAYPGYYYLTLSNTSALLLAPSLKFYLPNEWTLTADLTRGRDSSRFTDYFLTADTSELESSGCYCNRSHAWEIGVEGPLLQTGEEAVRLAAGIGSRGNDFQVHFQGADDGERGSDRSKFAYAELAVPLVSAQSPRPGVQRLELSVAARTEDYDSFGQVTTPKLGIIYDPVAALTLKAAWGRSFKAPTLVQRYSGRITYLWNADEVGGSGFPPGATLLMSYGGNPALKPERAKTWTASIALHPESLPGLDAELAYFSIDYTGRVAQPIANLNNVLSDPAYAQFVTYEPTEAQLTQAERYGDAFYNFTGADYDPGKVVAVARDEYVNVEMQQARGVDMNGSYRFDLTSGRLVMSLAASWLKSSQRDAADTPAFDLSGTMFHPAKFNGRFGMLWLRGGLTAAGFVNYTQGVTSSFTPVKERTSSFATFDTTVTYRTRDGGGLLDGLLISLGVQNLFDRKPPLYTPPSTDYVPYDSTNYSAIGRYVNVSLARHW
ncbi:MAG: TonB-dependent receptor domain-containing protein [Dyella sp.]|uniref:TonB-dependent receptor domain-containing protein n=1 Tax=Dyella sp. TaxID=1869338 RepID=UPI003F81FA93